jgi:hypothetical protein
MRSVTAILAFSALAVAACERGDQGRGAQTTLTSAETHPSPPPQSHAVDNSGFVDNSGNSAEERDARPDTSGARATEKGADRPTGTNTGVPNGARTGAAATPETPRPAELAPHNGSSPVASYGDEPGRLGRALCDRESVCTRIGQNRTWGSDDQCVSAMRARSTAEVSAMKCSIVGSALALCLASIRNAECNAPAESLSDFPDCRDTALCQR